MKWQWLPLLAVGLIVGAVCADELPPGGKQRTAELQSTADQASYGIGLNIGRNLKAEGFELNAEAIARGIRDGLAGSEPALTEEQLRAALTAFQRDAAAKQAERMQAAATKNKQEGEAYLTANAKKEGVVTLPSGLQYKVLKEGTGESPEATDSVKAHYHGTLIDGTVFDSSVERGEPVVFPLDGVIQGWTEGVTKMKVGGKSRLFIPAELAYGATPPPGSDIGPNAVLVFDVELLGIE